MSDDTRTSTKDASGNCAECGGWFMLRSDGAVPIHDYLFIGEPRCEGSHQAPKERQRCGGRPVSADGTRATCPHVVNSDEGTAYCALAANAIEARDAEIERLRDVVRVIGMDLDVEDVPGFQRPWLVLHPNGCIVAKRKITADQADAVRRALTTEGDTPPEGQP